MPSILCTSNDTLQLPRVATPDERKVDRSAPPPPSEEPWLCDEDYKYPIKSSKNSLEKCNDILARHDENKYRQLKEEINFLMVVAGLFLAIVAAFTIESYKFLQEDKQDTMSDLLVEVVRLLNDTSAQGTAQLPKPFKPPHHAIVVNQLWFLSLILSLVAVTMGIFWLQWIATFQQGTHDIRYDGSRSHEWHLMQSLRIEGLRACGWCVFYALEALLFTVQLSIGLFIYGLIYFLWNVSETATIPALVAASIAGALIILVNLLPFLQPLLETFLPDALTLPQCPYKSPTAWLIRSVGNILPYIIKLFLKLLPSNWVNSLGTPGKWLEDLTCPFTDFHWKKYDKICQDLRDRVCSRSLYIQSGFYRAGYLMDDKDVINVMPAYLGDLARSFVTSKDLKAVSRQKLSQDEENILNDHFALAPLPCRLNTMPLQRKYINKIKTDFISAIILQDLNKAPVKFALLLFPHHLELYIRVKNSTKSILRPDGSPLNFGQSLACPFKDNVKGIDELDLELKFQFLRCVRQLINTRRFNDGDILGAAVIVRNESNLSETQHMPAEEEHTGPPPNQSSSRNDQIGNISNQPDPGTTSFPPNALETGGPKSATHNTGAEDHQSRTSFESLCLDMRERLSQLTPSDFEYSHHYEDLRQCLGLPIEPEPETAHTVVNVPEYEGT